jgi:hypothetical protein
MPFISVVTFHPVQVPASVQPGLEVLAKIVPELPLFFLYVPSLLAAGCTGILSSTGSSHKSNPFGIANNGNDDERRRRQRIG